MTKLTQYKKHFSAVILASMAQSMSAQPTQAQVFHVNPLKLYSEVTSLTMAFNAKYGKESSLPSNAKAGVNKIIAHSNTQNYMGTKTYNDYAQNSQFAKDANSMMTDLSQLITSFKKIGFIQEIKAQNQTPAIMFDIDNTIELTSFDDDYYTKSGINDPATAQFIKTNCFKDGVDCYFITARSCNVHEASATKQWLQKHLHLSDQEISKYVFLSGAIPSDACTGNPNERVAYKDVLRRALSEKQHVYWLMSIGDQMTDWFGLDSGLKVWYPNMMFDSSIVENNHNNPKTSLHLQTVTTPTNQCYTKLKEYALRESTINYCLAFKTDHYVNAKPRSA